MPRNPTAAPTRIYLDPDLDLHSLEAVTRKFGVRANLVTHWLGCFSVPILAIGDQEYFNMATLKRALRLVTDLGSDGFIAPGADASTRNTPIAKKRLRALTPEMILQLEQNSPEAEVRQTVIDLLSVENVARLLQTVKAGNKKIASKAKKLGLKTVATEIVYPDAPDRGVRQRRTDNSPGG